MEAATRALEKKLNWLRAAVLGANDGIVSIAGVVIGVASAGADKGNIMLAGIAAVVAGAI
jgi:VIT1/CCC1 family predicted Fe2+/Mn2+ transporter